MIIQRQITWKWYNIPLYLQWLTNGKYHSFKVTPFFDAEYLRNGTTYRHNDIEKLIGTYTRPTQPCHFEWHWVTLSDLANIQWHEASRGLCDSWASCWKCADAVYPKLSQLVRGCQMYCLPKLVRFWGTVQKVDGDDELLDYWTKPGSWSSRAVSYTRDRSQCPLSRCLTLTEWSSCRIWLATINFHRRDRSHDYTRLLNNTWNLCCGREVARCFSIVSFITILLAQYF